MVSLFRFSWELQFGVGSYGEPHESPRFARKGDAFTGRKGTRKDYSKQSSWLFIGKSLKERRGSFLFLDGLCYRCRAWKPPSSCLLTLLHWGFCLWIFHKINFLTTSQHHSNDPSLSEVFVDTAALFPVDLKFHGIPKVYVRGSLCQDWTQELKYIVLLKTNVCEDSPHSVYGMCITLNVLAFT